MTDYISKPTEKERLEIIDNAKEEIINNAAPIELKDVAEDLLALANEKVLGFKKAQEKSNGKK